jgi:isopenicillin N synthase-like dioxygenase
MHDMTEVATVDLRDLDAGGPRCAAMVAHLGRSLTETGFVKVVGHGIGADVLERCYAAARDVFAMSDAVKARYVRDEIAGARGLIPFGREQAKGAAIVDLKEFWHIGPPDGPGLANVWPDDVPEFQPAMVTLFARMEAASQLLLEGLACFLGLPRRRLADLVVGGTSLLRVLHYPPLRDRHIDGAVRAAPHEDINFITLLPAATDAGLELLDRHNRWCAVDAGPDEIVADTGDMMHRFLNGRIPATTHRVVNPADSDVERYSMPFFCQPRGDVILTPPPELLTPGETVPPSVTAAEFHTERIELIRGRRA